MTMSMAIDVASPTVDSGERRARWRDALAYPAPFLEKKLMERRLVDSPEEASAVFDEIKKYLVLQEEHRGRSFPMFSERLDEVWHQFVLFTVEYADYCERFFGRHMAHLPENAPAMERIPGGAEISFDEFRATYQALFGTPLSELWNDELSIGLHRRLIRGRQLKSLFARALAGKAELCTEAECGEHVLIRVDDWGLDALSFVAAVTTFYVRELPGLVGEDQVALARGLFRANVVRVAP
jgi:hypothetical protein